MVSCFRRKKKIPAVAARKLKISSILVGLLLWSVRLRTGGAPEQGISYGRLPLHPRNRAGATGDSRVAPEGMLCAVRGEPDARRGGVFFALVDLRFERPRHPDCFHQRLGCRAS